VLVSTQLPEQSVNPPAQVALQVPLLQTSPPLHALLHWPQ
jgi:hypothetical protein